VMRRAMRPGVSAGMSTRVVLVLGLHCSASAGSAATGAAANARASQVRAMRKIDRHVGCVLKGMLAMSPARK